METCNLLTWEGYIEKFYEFIQEGYTHNQSYEMTERILYARFGVNRYTSYESFKSEKSRRSRSSKKVQTR